MPRPLYSQCTPLPAITSTVSRSGHGSCGGSWAKYSGKCRLFFFPLAKLLCHESGAYHTAIPPFSALTLWQHDNSLTIALEVCKAFLEPIEYLTSLYPGPGAWPRVSAVFLHSYTQLIRLVLLVQQAVLDDLRERIRLALFTAEATGDYVPTPVEML